MSKTRKSPEGLAENTLRGQEDQRAAPFLANCSSERYSRDSNLCRTVKLDSCLAGQGPVFNCAFFPIFPEGRLTRPLEIQRRRDIFSSNNGLHLKLATLLKKYSKNIWDNILYRLEVCSFFFALDKYFLRIC